MEQGNTTNFDVPSASEKQAHKFILDALKEEDALDQEIEESSPPRTRPVVGTAHEYYRTGQP